MLSLGNNNSKKTKLKKTKLYPVLYFFILFAFVAKAQQGESEKCIGEGKFIVDAYYGYPYVMGNYIRDSYSSYYAGTLSDEKVVNYNHVGGKCEYLINDIVGMGVDYTYAKVIYTYTDAYYVSGQSAPKYDRFTESLTKQRFLLRVNIHFATTSELDPYATAGVGYKQTIFKTNNPNNYNYDMSFFNAFPVSFRLGAGLRWFFTNNIGISVEAGVGGPSIQGGICAKF